MEPTVEAYVALWKNRCYGTDIPDTVPPEIFNRAPSYQKIAISILKNDLTPLGVSPRKTKYYSELKRMELRKRGVIKQLELF